uniref:Fibronectin type III-like domain-containing protein n=1 Tax=Oryza brachyantha TaxID=4533 RepID=J3N7J4_ORYBR
MHFNGTVRGITSFPQVLLTAAAFDDALWFRIGQCTVLKLLKIYMSKLLYTLDIDNTAYMQAIGTEARALYNLGQAEGLTIWSPNVNIFRDPRWGRGQETPGEDPTTASKYAVAFVRGLQGNSPATALQTSACCKHATAYDLEDWNGVARYNFNARETTVVAYDFVCNFICSKSFESMWPTRKAGVTAQDLADTFNPPFKSCVVDGKATCIMCAYTGINGVPACANSDLLSKTVRGDWGLDGYVSSDCDAVAIMRDAQRYAPTPEDTVAVAIKAGLDLNCGTYTQEHGMAALRQGKMSEKDVDRALTNLFAVRMRLGHFDGDPRGSAAYGHLGAADVCTQAHRDLALEAAQDGIVLRFAATGQAAALASSSDRVVLVMGLSQDQEKEGLDRTSLLLPGKQQSLITAVANAARRPGILAGGLAIARVLFGDHNPSGRLPVTWYPEEFTKIPMTDMRMRADPATGYPGRSYRFYQGKPVYKFGYGLSYSKFTRRLVTDRPGRNLLAGVAPRPAGDGGESYHVEEIGAEGCEQLKFPVAVEVENQGPMDGKHSVLVFVRWPNATTGESRAARQLVGFRSQHVKAGEKARVAMEVDPCEHLSRARVDGKKVIDRGSHFLMVGGEEDAGGDHWEISFDA